MLNSVAYSPDRKSFAAGSGYRNRPSQNVLWDVQTDKQRVDFDNLWGVSSMAFSPDGKTVAAWTMSHSVDDDYRKSGELRLYDPDTGKKKETLDKKGVRFAAFSPDVKTLASAGPGDVVTLLRLTTR